MRTQRSRRLAAAVLVVAASVALTAAAAPVVQAAPPAAPALVARGYGASVTLPGHGFGHGIGMSQVGAYGYAVKLGWTWDQILGHYYGGTTLGPSDPNQAFSVRLTAGDDDPVTAVIQDGGAVATSATGAELYRVGGRRRGGAGLLQRLRPHRRRELPAAPPRRPSSRRRAARG